MKRIPLARPFIKTDVVLEEVKKVLDSRWISGGPTIAKFEEAVRDYNNDPDGFYVAVANGTVALELALLMINGGVKLTFLDEVIVPSWSWVASGFAVENVGGKPIYCDVNEFGVPSVETIEPLITTETLAIIIVHQMGIPCDLDAINKLADKHGIPIIEDGAAAIGSEYKGDKLGKTGNIFTYSFQARKALTTGEGGMVVVRSEADAKWLKSIRAFGTNVSPLERDKTAKLMKENFDKFGTNNKMSDITAAVGLAHLSYLDEELELRKKAGEYYTKKVFGMAMDGFDIRPANLIPEYCTRYNWANYHVVFGDSIDRDNIVDKLRKRGIGCKWDIQAIHKEPVYDDDSYTEDDDLPVTMAFHNHGFWLPFFAEITEDAQDYVIENLSDVLNGKVSQRGSE